MGRRGLGQKNNDPDWILGRLEPSGDCLVWPGTKANHYGDVTFRGQKWRVHRLVWTLANGPIPDGLWVLHHCDNPPCARLDHLFLGTQADNMQDALAKGRHGHGETGPKVHASRKATHCPQGHPYDEVNTYVNARGNRDCRACRRERTAAWKAANPARASASIRRWKQAHPEQVREHQRRWKESQRG